MLLSWKTGWTKFVEARTAKATRKKRTRHAAVSQMVTVISFTTPAHGNLTDNGKGSFTYSPALNFNGSDSFNYTISDGQGRSASATVIITIATAIEPVETVDVSGAGSLTTITDANSKVVFRR